MLMNRHGGEVIILLVPGSAATFAQFVFTCCEYWYVYRHFISFLKETTVFTWMVQNQHLAQLLYVQRQYNYTTCVLPIVYTIGRWWTLYYTPNPPSQMAFLHCWKCIKRDCNDSCKWELLVMCTSIRTALVGNFEE